MINGQPRRGPLVFGEVGSDYTSTFRRTVEGIRKRAGVDWHFHLLRHYFGSTLLAQGVDIVAISSLLGHSKMMTTFIYSHTDDARKRRTVDTIIDTMTVDVQGEKRSK